MAYYHVRLTPLAHRRLTGDELALDLSREQLEQRFLILRREGRPVTLGGRSYSWEEIDRLRINETEDSSAQLLPQIKAERAGGSARAAIPDKWYVTTKGRDVTDELITEPPGSATLAAPSGPSLFHVQVRKGWFSTAEAFNLSEEELRERFVEPWLEGRQVIVGSKAWLPTEAELSIYEGPRLSTQQRALGQGWLNVTQFGEKVTDRFITGAPTTAAIARKEAGAPNPRAVAVAYGRDGQARAAVFDFLRALGLDPLEWEELVAQTESATPYTGEAVEAAFRIAQAVVVLFTPDDEARLHDELHSASGEPEHERHLTGQPRPNVLLEAGTALATHSDRTLIVEIGAIRPISNLGGRNVVRVDGSAETLNAAAARLERAGCNVRRDRGDWLNGRRFSELLALRRRPGNPSAATTTSEDELLVEAQAAAERAGLKESPERDRAVLAFLRSREEPFGAEELDAVLPRPRLEAIELKRLASELFKVGLLRRNPQGRGWMPGDELR